VGGGIPAYRLRDVKRIAALDGLRGVAILLVLLGHTRLPVFKTGGQVGVTLFFVLSGYLITGILVKGVGFRRFYVRRARRLIPALILAVIGASILSPDGWWDRAWPALAYIGNVPLIHGGDLALGNLSHVWSLAVEEHFYLVWPVVIAIVPTRWRIRTVVALTIGFALWRLQVYGSGASWERIYFGTDMNAVAILTGASIAVCNPPRLHPIVGRTAVVLLAGAAMLPVDHIFRTSFLVVLVAAVAVQAARTGGLLEGGTLRWLGTISYGLYLWHIPIFHLFDNRLWGWPIALCAAWASWRLVEKPILDLGLIRRIDPEVMPTGIHRSHAA
jgi:peptidoglycan/LPS O-acetylase OafA/YrhL